MSREIDALIAKHVMGFSIVNTEIGMFWRDHDNRTIYRIDQDHLPHFSEAISDSWLVVEKILATPVNWTTQEGFYRGENPGVGHRLRIEIIKNNHWEVSWRDGNWNCYASANHENLPMAICLASLNALGVDYEPEINKEVL